MRHPARTRIFIAACTLLLVAATPTVKDASSVCTGSQPDAFSDDTGNVHESAINCLADRDITSGKGNGLYAPVESVTRAQVATFVARTLTDAGEQLPTNNPDAYNDDSAPHAENIDALAALDIIVSTDAQYRPNEPATRAFMAETVARALAHFHADANLDTQEDYFTDDDGSATEDLNNMLADQGIVLGDGRGNLSPSDTLRRDQMASFLTRLRAVLEDGPRPATGNPDATFQPINVSGSGTDVVTLAAPNNSLAILTATHDGDSNFIVRGLDAEGETKAFLVNEIGEYNGTVAFNFGSFSRPEIVEVQVDADGDWSFTLEPLGNARPLSATDTITYTGPDIRIATMVAGEILEMTHDGSSNFIVTGYEQDGSYADNYANEIGEYDGAFRVANDVAYLRIDADGEWTAQVRAS